jgi:hypothetical protein
MARISVRSDRSRCPWGQRFGAPMEGTNWPTVDIPPSCRRRSRVGVPSTLGNAVYFPRGLTSGLEDDAAAYFDGMVGEPLIEPAQQCHVHRCCDPVLPLSIHQHSEQVAM